MFQRKIRLESRNKCKSGSCGGHAPLAPCRGERRDDLLLCTVQDLRDVDAVKDKYYRLKNAQKETGRPEMIEAIKWAKEIEIEICKKDDVGELGGINDMISTCMPSYTDDMWGQTT